VVRVHAQDVVVDWVHVKESGTGFEIQNLGEMSHGGTLDNH
jgi:hypothetical protein